MVKLPNGRYRMYFVSPPEGPYATKIMSAISEDGINWLQEKGIRFQQPNLPLIDPAVIKMGNIWRMYVWYDALGTAKIITATSNDGLTFTREREFQVGGGVPEIVRLDSGNYALYFCRNGIEMTTSSDGLTWGTARVALSLSPSSIVCDPSVIKTKNGDWVMFYKKQ